MAAVNGIVRWVATATLIATPSEDPGRAAATLVSSSTMKGWGTIGTEVLASASLDALAGTILDGALTYGGGAIAKSSATLVAKGKIDGDHSISIKEVVDEMLLMWGIESTALARDFLKQQAINEINASMQMVSAQAKGLDYLGRTTRTYALTQQQRSVTLESDVQNVEGPVRWVRPAVALEELSGESPYVWRLDLGRLERGYFTITLTVDGTATAYSVFVEEVDGTDPWLLSSGLSPSIATAGESTRDTGRENQALDGPGILAAFEANAKVNAGDLFITGKWPEYRFELTTAHTSTLAISNISSSTIRSEDPPLRPIASRGQLESWRQTLGAYTTGHPEYYYISRTRTGNAEGTAIALEIRPDPDLGVGVAVGSLSVDVAIEPSRFTFDDYSVSKEIPLPHRYVESLFLPIVRFRGMVSHYYVGSQEASASIQANYQAALVQFGIVDPQIEEAQEVATTA